MACFRSRAKAAAADLRIRFVYKSDADRDRWNILRGAGYVRGDCEDFALTMLWLCAGRSMLRFWWLVLTFQAVVWFCRSSRGGEGHACLWLRGQGWIDNIYPDWNQAARHSLRFPYLGPYLAVAMLIKR